MAGKGRPRTVSAGEQRTYHVRLPSDTHQLLMLAVPPSAVRRAIEELCDKYREGKGETNT
jgi:hypothetical protein